MLINNIITCSLVDAKPEEALSVYNKYSPIIKPTNNYERIIYDLNKIHLFWRTNQIDSFKYHLDRLKINIPGELFEAKRDLHYLYYYTFTNDISRFAELFSKYRKQITSNPNEFLIQWCALLAYAQSKGMPIFNYQELIQLYNNPSIAANKKLKSNLSYLLYQNRKGTAEGDKWRIEHLNLELDIQSSEALTFQNNLKNQLKMNELYDENNKIKLKMELDSTEKTVYIITLIGTILVLLLGGISFLFFQKNRKNAIQKLQLELQNNRNINELNQNKKQFAERLISANQAINKKLDKIASKLKQSNFGKDPEIIQIRRELEGITEIKDDWGNELNQIKAIDGIKFLLDYFQSVQLFNQTEQPLLAYFINGHKVKEIATLMNLSEQHVRNTKTKVLKALSQEHQTEVSIEQLIELKGKGLI
jgi:DNA-binding CsgD family transcriptional regulator